MAKKHSQQIGKDFEDQLETVHEQYYWKGKACLWRNELKARVVYTPSGPKIVRVKSQPDFSGVLQGGRFVYFDAKSINQVQQWTLPEKNRHQYEALYQASLFGALAFFLLEARKKKLYYVVLVHPIIERQFYKGRRPRVSLKASEDQPHVISFETSTGGIDWLQTIQQHAAETEFTPAMLANESINR